MTTFAGRVRFSIGGDRPLRRQGQSAGMRGEIFHRCLNAALVQTNFHELHAHFATCERGKQRQVRVDIDFRRG